MPNFWTKTTQKIAEAFSGPRTKDIEFDQKVDEMKKVEKGMTGFKHLLNNFLNYTVNIRNMSKEFTSSIKGVYEKDSPFSLIANDLIDAHIDMEKFYDEFQNNVTKLVSKTSEWNSLFAHARVELNKRESFRKTYDHYDEKLEKIYKERAERIKKNHQMESSKEIDFVERNERKYKSATETYVKSGETAFITIQTILDKRYSLINPIISEFVEDERIFFLSLSNLFKKFESIGIKFREISSSMEKTEVTYDPCKYVRGKEIVDPSKEKSPREKSKQVQSEEEDKRYRSKSNTPLKNTMEDTKRSHVRKQTEEYNNNYSSNHNTIHNNNNNNNNNNTNTNNMNHLNFALIDNNFGANRSNNISPNREHYSRTANQTHNFDVDYEGFNNISNHFNMKQNSDSARNFNQNSYVNNDALKQSPHPSGNKGNYSSNSNSSNCDNSNNQSTNYNANQNYPRFSELDIEGSSFKAISNMDYESIKQNMNDGMKAVNQVSSYTKTANQFIVNSGLNNNFQGSSFSQKNQSNNNVNSFLHHTTNKKDNFVFDHIFNNNNSNNKPNNNASRSNNNPHKNVNNDIFKDLF